MTVSEVSDLIRVGHHLYYHDREFVKHRFPELCPRLHQKLPRYSSLGILRVPIATVQLTVPYSPTMPSATSAPKSDARLLLISNRLPITIKRSEDGSYDFSMSSGGLVSGLSGLSKSTTFQWYGWPGLEVPEKEAGPLTERLKDEYNAVPVFIDDELADRHYNGFSSTLSC